MKTRNCVQLNFCHGLALVSLKKIIVKILELRRLVLFSEILVISFLCHKFNSKL